MTRAHLSFTTALAALLLSPGLCAEPTARDRAAAEAIFRQATALMDEQKYAEACEKLAASQQLDPGLGTQLYLADCYDRAGRTASAWALFREVEELSHRAAQGDRERIASERASALEGKLSKLEVRIPPESRAPNLELWVGGTAIPTASWNVALPVDPGPTKIEARAPGKRPLLLQIVVEPGPSSRTVVLPVLADTPREAPLQATTAQRPVVPPPSSTQRTVGYVLAGVGLVAVAAGGYFGYRAYAQNSDSKAECRAEDASACTQAGFNLRKQARTSAAASTVLSVGGGVLTVGGIALVLAAPAPHQQLAAWEMHVRGEF